MLGADRRGQVRDELAEEGEAADVLEAAAAVELVGDGHLVDRLVALPEGEARLVGPGVGLTEEIGRLEDGGNLEDRFVVHQEGGDDGLFGLDIVGW